MIRVGIAGFGYWGPKLSRSFGSDPEMCVAVIADPSAERRAIAARHHPAATIVRDLSEMLRSGSIDAVAIATPLATHFDMAHQSLLAGKHVFVEKPLASNKDQVLRLIDAAERRGLVLQVDHTFVHTGAVKEVARLLEAGTLGKPYYYESTRANFGIFQSDTNVVWDLAVHDLALLDRLFDERPRAVSAFGMSHAGGHENVAYLTILYDSSFIAHISVNWLSPIKMRRIVIGCSQQLVVYDDTEGADKVKVYDKSVVQESVGHDVQHLRTHYRVGEMRSPAIDLTEALVHAAREFRQAILGRQASMSNALSGLRAVQLLEAATASMQAHGRLIDVTSVVERERVAKNDPIRRFGRAVP
jgi:predicted dehydrogenase